jgi:hypothetical protein
MEDALGGTPTEAVETTALPKKPGDRCWMDVFSSLTGLDWFVVDSFPSHEWLGYFQGYRRVKYDD